MKYKIKDLKGFTNCVFGADCFLEYWPEIHNEGVELKEFRDGFHYIMLNDQKAHDTAFFSNEEMKYLEPVI
jgi:hypothetical protein